MGSTPRPTTKICGEIQGDGWDSLLEDRGKSRFSYQILGGGGIHKFVKSWEGSHEDMMGT